MIPMFELLERRQFLSAAINTALVSAPPIITANTNPEQISVEFRSRSAIRIKTINAGDLTDSAGFAVLGVTTSSDRQHRDIIATYSIAAPTGEWTTARNGAYSFEMTAGQVRNQNGGRSLGIQGSFSVDIPAVSISGVSPTVAFFGHQPITISGSGFESGLKLLFTDPSGNVNDETDEDLTVSSTQITGSIGLVSTPGTWTAEVINPDGGDSGQFSFNVQAKPPLPPPVSIASVSPVVAFFGHQSITINGSGFESGLKLLFTDPSGNVNDETDEDLMVSSTQITGSIGLVSTPGTWTAEVVNPDGGDSGLFSFNVT